jgi:hypothetical protein
MRLRFSSIALQKGSGFLDELLLSSKKRECEIEIGSEIEERAGCGGGGEKLLHWNRSRKVLIGSSREGEGEIGRSHPATSREHKFGSDQIRIGASSHDRIPDFKIRGKLKRGLLSPVIDHEPVASSVAINILRKLAAKSSLEASIGESSPVQITESAGTSCIIKKHLHSPDRRPLQEQALLAWTLDDARKIRSHGGGFYLVKDLN